MRILLNNEVQASSVYAEIPYYQRLFYTPTANVFVVGELVTGTTSGASGIIDFIGTGWMDIIITDDITFLLPNANDRLTIELITSPGGGNAQTILDTEANISGRPQVSHPDFPISNMQDVNRNLITTSKAYQDNEERNFKNLNFGSSLAVATNINCVAIIGHNFSPTAIMTVSGSYLGVNVFTRVITNPNRIITSIDSLRAQREGSIRADSENYKNITTVYFDTAYLLDSVNISVIDTASTEKFIWFGSLYIGEYWQPETTTYYGWSNTMVDTSTVVYAQSPYSQERPKYSMLQLPLQNITAKEVSDWEYVFQSNGKHNDIIVDLLYNTIDLNEKSAILYGRFNVDNIAFVNDYSDRYSTAVQFRESI